MYASNTEIERGIRADLGGGDFAARVRADYAGGYIAFFGLGTAAAGWIRHWCLGNDIAVPSEEDRETIACRLLGWSA